MPNHAELTMPPVRRTRRSLGGTSGRSAVDKENMTMDMGAFSGAKKTASAPEKSTKKSRSKSIGPGGLDVLKDSSGNRRKSMAPLPRGILKPTLPPLREFSAYSTSRGDATLTNPFQIEVTSIINDRRQLEQQEAEARERERREREKLAAEIEARRAARRKSLANRRVSFAPEATLHTWDVIEYAQDSTTSSASTSSTRRESSASSAYSVPGTPRPHASDLSDPPSTPPEQEDVIAESPEHQRDLHQRRRRRSSGIPPLNFNNPDDAFSSSPYSDHSSDMDIDDKEPTETLEDDLTNSESDDDDDDDDETMMSLDEGDATDMSVISTRSDMSDMSDSSTQLNANLRLAAQQAETQALELDQQGSTEEDVVASFAPWKKPQLPSTQDQENVDPFSQSYPPGPQDDVSNATDMSMEMTRAVGGIFPQSPTRDNITMEMTEAVGGILRAQPTSPGEMTMEMTRPIGGIIPQAFPQNGDETMEMTRAMGGIIHGRTSNEETTMEMTGTVDRILPSSGDDMTMEMTQAVGGFISLEQPDDSTMDITRPVGRILAQQLPTEDVTMEMTRAVGVIIPQQTPAKTAGGMLQQSPGDMTMEMTRAMGSILPAAGEDLTMEMTRAVGGILSPPRPESPENDTMEMTRAVGGILPSLQLEAPHNDMTMEMTRAIGGIIESTPSEAPTRPTPSPTVPHRRQSTRRRSSMRQSFNTTTMEMTSAVGGIINAVDESTINETDEDMSMEFTSVVGGMLAKQSPPKSRRQSFRPSKSRKSLMDDGEIDMEVTTAFGGILPEPEDTTRTSLGMDMTRALGGILPKQLSTGSRAHAKEIMELEADAADLGSSPFRATPLNSPRRPNQPETTMTDLESPSIAAFKGREVRRSGDGKLFGTPTSRVSRLSVEKPTTPLQTMSPTSQTPSKLQPKSSSSFRTEEMTTPQSHRSLRSGATTPVIRIEQPQSVTRSARSTAITPNKLFQRNNVTGAATPSIVLSPKRRRSSGLGIDRPGLGSPKVAALFDRRSSLGSVSTPLSVGRRSSPEEFRLEDPRTLELEVENDLRESEDRESGRKILQLESDETQKEKDVTFNLKGMIESMTPKKKPITTRKSLHTGAAKGLLGKRPAELDDDDEPEDGVKRLKGLQESPVKSIKLKAPPSMEETRRITRSSRKSLAETSTNITPTTRSPSKRSATSPRRKGRFFDALIQSPSVPLVEHQPTESPQVDESDDRIHLQDFLNLTSIRFMELTTTKRRHTVVPSAANADESEHEASLPSCVTAGACTVPMLELYQHSCHELKKYISEGRRIVREIEDATYDENPPLFREYLSASPDIRVLMDNQFKNVKTHSRLQSKAMWYEWRMKLLENLINDGLLKTHESLMSDDKLLREQEELLDSVLPALSTEYEELIGKESDLRKAAAELVGCDQEELAKAREELVSLDGDIEEKKRLIAELQSQLQAAEDESLIVAEKKRQFQQDIRNSEQIREECRGWSAKEVGELKARVEALEKEHGWIITGISGTTTSMTFRREIELVFDAAAFRNDKPSNDAANSPIDLWYIAANRPVDAQPLTPEKEFFLQSIRDRVRSLDQHHSTVPMLLAIVSQAWTQAAAVLDNLRLLHLACPTTITRTADDTLLARATLLLSPLATKLAVSITITTAAGAAAADAPPTITAVPLVSVVYGEKYNESKMAELVAARMGGAECWCTAKDAWGVAVEELGRRLLARAQK